MSNLVERQIEPFIDECLTAFRVVILNGPRQSGKSTLLEQVAKRLAGTLVTLDDRETLRAARTDPGGFVTGHHSPLLIDEIQRGGEPLVLAIKADADRNPRDVGRFVLAGSSRFLTVPNLNESLAGRAVIIDVWPFSQAELHGGSDRFIDAAFEPTAGLRSLVTPTVSRSEVSARIIRGGFPGLQNIETARLRTTWFGAYLRTLIDRDLAEYRRPGRTVDVNRLARLILGRTAQELHVANIANDLGVTADTVRDYLALTETLFLHHCLPAWSGGHTGRVVKRPKIHAVDVGLAAHVLGTSVDSLSNPTSALLGPLFETFVVNELAKQQTWSETPRRLHHYRDGSRREIDLIIEASNGTVVAIEVKAAKDVDETDFRHLAAFRDQLGDRFVNGIVVHLGTRPLPFGDRLTAMPVSGLWNA